MNLDGILDFLLLAKPSNKMLQEIIAAELYMNEGPGTRYWSLVPGAFLEFASTAIATDLDGDGRARELMLWRMQLPLCERANQTYQRLKSLGRLNEPLRDFSIDHDMWYVCVRQQYPPSPHPACHRTLSHAYGPQRLPHTQDVVVYHSRPWYHGVLPHA